MKLNANETEFGVRCVTAGGRSLCWFESVRSLCKHSRGVGPILITYTRACITKYIFALVNDVFMSALRYAQSATFDAKCLALGRK